jgi:hypothetical protein
VDHVKNVWPFDRHTGLSASSGLPGGKGKGATKEPAYVEQQSPYGLQTGPSYNWL